MEVLNVTRPEEGPLQAVARLYKTWLRYHLMEKEEDDDDYESFDDYMRDMYNDPEDLEFDEQEEFEHPDAIRLPHRKYFKLITWKN
jgi:hypothetical protein